MAKSDANRRVLPAKHPPSSVSSRRLSSVVKDVGSRSSPKHRKLGATDSHRSDKHK